MPLPPLEHVVYGPVRSRRLGRSLGINLLPPGLKLCNMNCAYCQYGWSVRAARRRRQHEGVDEDGMVWPAPQAVESAVTLRLLRAAESNELIDRLTVAGHGEPTLHPDFAEVVERLCAARSRIAPDLPIAILSNSTTAARPHVRRGLERFDERYMKLDAADPITYARVNGASTSIDRMVDALATLAPITIQAMFVSDPRGEVDNTTDAIVGQWVDALEQIRAAAVHIYTIDRAPALARLRAVSARRLREIAERVRSAGIPATVFARR